jgi:hypothetical protein
MRRHLFTAAFIVLILSIVNFFGALVNQSLNYAGGLKHYGFSFVSTVIFAVIYLGVTAIPWKISDSFKLPFIRTVFWTLFVSSELFIEPNIDGEPSYILYLVNSGLNLFWNTLFLSIGKLGFFIENYILNILAFGIYEVCVIHAARLIAAQVDRQRTAVSSTRE